MDEHHGQDRATAQDTEQWLDIGPLDAVCRDYPDVAKILRGWIPHRLLSSSGILNLTSTLRCQVALIGDGAAGVADRAAVDYLLARLDEDRARARMHDVHDSGLTHPYDPADPCDPTRVLADIAAKHLLLAPHVGYHDCLAPSSCCSWTTSTDFAEIVLPALLAPYVARPGFRAEWLDEVLRGRPDDQQSLRTDVPG